MAPKLSQTLLSLKEDLNELTQTRGWNTWLREFIEPKLKSIRRDLLTNEKMELTDRIARQKVLKLMDEFIKLAYEGGLPEETTKVLEKK